MQAQGLPRRLRALAWRLGPAHRRRRRSLGAGLRGGRPKFAGFHLRPGSVLQQQWRLQQWSLGAGLSGPAPGVGSSVPAQARRIPDPGRRRARSHRGEHFLADPARACTGRRWSARKMGEGSLDFDLRCEYRLCKHGPSVVGTLESFSVSRPVTGGMTGLWQPCAHSALLFDPSTFPLLRSRIRECWDCSPTAWERKLGGRIPLPSSRKEPTPPRA